MSAPVSGAAPAVGRILFRLALPSDPRLVSRLAGALASAAAAASGIGAEAEFRLRLALAEALDNAARHGNRCDPSRRVRLRCRVRPGLVRCSVADEGKGFPAESRSDDPTSRGRLERGSGRGLFLMRRAADRIRHEEGGSRVRLVVSGHAARAR